MQFDDLCRFLVVHHHTFARTDTVMPLLDADGIRTRRSRLKDLGDQVITVPVLRAARGQQRQQALVYECMALCQVPDQPAVLQQRVRRQVTRVGQPDQVLIEYLGGPVQQVVPCRQLRLDIRRRPVFVIEQVAHACCQIVVLHHDAAQQVEFKKHRAPQQPSG